MERKKNILFLDKFYLPQTLLQQVAGAGDEKFYVIKFIN